MADLASLDIFEVYEKLGAEPRGKRGRAFWRDGDGYNISLNAEKNAWFDFRDGRGGGILDLVMIARDCDQRAALNWLETYCALDPLRPLSPEERRRRKLAEVEARDLIAWRDGIVDVIKWERDRCFRLHHQAVRWILANGLDSELGSIVADISDIFEERALTAERGIDTLRKTPVDLLLPMFRRMARWAA